MPTRTRPAVLLSALLLLGAGCGQDSAQPSKPAEPPTVQGVAVEAAATAEILETTEALGTVRARTVTAVSSRIMGRILALHAREGSAVEAGRLLVELDDSDIAAQLKRAEAGLSQAESGLAELERAEAAAAAALAAAEAQRELAASTLARYRTLAERKAVAPQELDEVTARHKAAAAEVARAAAEGEVVRARRHQIRAAMETARAEIAGVQVLRTHTKIAAPTAGVVTATHAEVGAMAGPGLPLLTLESGRHWLEIAVPESQLAGLRPGQSLRIAVDGAGLSLAAPVAEILPVTDPATRTATVRIGLPAAPALRSGLFGRAWIPTGRRPALLVPRRSVVLRGQLQGLYVVGQDSIARFRLIQTGPDHADRVEVLAGLAAGERIVTSGIERVTDGARIQPERVRSGS